VENDVNRAAALAGTAQVSHAPKTPPVSSAT
jgi:hypothetical protein